MHRTPDTPFTVTPIVGLADLTSLFLVYQRLCGPVALGVYGYLMQAELTESATHAQLANDLGLTHDQLVVALISLEEVNLVDALYSSAKKRYRYVLRQPLSVSDALMHPVYGRAFLQSVGEKAYATLLGKVSVASEEDYQRVTRSFDVGRLRHYDASQEAVFESQAEPVSGLRFNLSEFNRRCSELVLPQALRTSANLTAIAELGSVYGIGPQAMVRHVGKVVNPGSTELDLMALEKALLKESPNVTNVDDPYTLEPILFLKHLQKGMEPTDTEKRLISSLVIRQRLNPEVVNVLIEHALASSSDKSLKKAYVETIAASWSRLGIATKQQALDHITTAKPSTKKKARIEPIPNYNEEQQKSLSQDEMDALIKRFRKSGDPHGKD
jgi:replication initiation and membrane attachment protein